MGLSEEIKEAVEAAVTAVSKVKEQNNNLSGGLREERNCFIVEVHSSLALKDGKETPIVLKLPVQGD